VDWEYPFLLATQEMKPSDHPLRGPGPGQVTVHAHKTLDCATIALVVIAKLLGIKRETFPVDYQYRLGASQKYLS